MWNQCRAVGSCAHAWDRIGWEEGFINLGRGVGKEENSPYASSHCKLSHHVMWPRDRSFLPLASGTRSAEVERIVQLVVLVPSNSLHLDNSSNVSWFYCITVLGDTILLFYQCYETSEWDCLKSPLHLFFLVVWYIFVILWFKCSRYRLCLR